MSAAPAGAHDLFGGETGGLHHRLISVGPPGLAAVDAVALQVPRNRNRAHARLYGALSRSRVGARARLRRNGGPRCHVNVTLKKLPVSAALREC
jgi:hypothetical protein